GAGISSRSLGGAGNGGRIDVFTNHLLIDGKNKGSLTGIAAGAEDATVTGDGGAVNIGSADQPLADLTITGGGGITSVTQGTGRGGPIHVFSHAITLRD